MPTKYRLQIEIAAAIHDLDANLIEAVVLQESSGRPTAYRFEPNFWAKYMAGRPEYKDAIPERVSASYGLMQTMFVVAKEVGFSEPDPEMLFVPRLSLEFGCRKLKQLLVWAHGVVPQALAAYNGGRKANAQPPYRNQTYADSVLAYLSDVTRARAV